MSGGEVDGSRSAADADGGAPRRIVVLGGGITGLSAAFYADKLMREAGTPAAITVVERSGQFGGKIRTLHRDGCVIERGPDSFLARKRPILDLSHELGIVDQLVATNPQAKKTYILHKGVLHRMPPGLVLGIPTQIAPFLRTGLLSVRGKARAALDFVLPRRREAGDESLGGFLQRRLGAEVLRHIAEPLLAGIYAGDTHELSLAATFPQFQAAERQHGSLIRGMMASRKTPPAASDAGVLPPELRGSLFLSYRCGLGTLVDALLGALAHARLATGCAAVAIDRGEAASGGGDYSVALDSGETLYADAVIAALPVHAAADLLPPLEALRGVGYVSVANVILAYDRARVGHPLDGSGFVVPRTEGRFITACTWTSSKWRHTAPEGTALLRCYVGRSGEEAGVELPDGELLARVRRDIRELMGIEVEPRFAEVTRWRHSMPQYPVGHLDNVRRAREALAASMPGVAATGAGFHGVGLPDCIRQGKEAAQQVCAFLLARP